MAYTIVNDADKFSGSGQSSPDKVDFDIITAGSGLTGVVSGCAATVTGSNMVVTIAAGVIIVAGKEVTVAAGDVTVTTAHATLNRYDLVTVNSSGTKAVTAGTAASNPVFPAVPAGSVCLYAVWVPAADTAITSGQLVDKRVFIVRDTDALAYIYF